MKGVDVTWLNTVGHGDLEAAVWRTEAIEEAAKAVVAAAEASAPGLSGSIPWELLRALAVALEGGS